jgi:hypothetical protein
MYEGMLGRAYRRQEVYVVGLDEVKFMAFDTHLRSIGTAELGGCSTVMILSHHAVIFGHIAPLPAVRHSDDYFAGDRHCENMMRRVAELYNANQHYFPTDESWVVCALQNNEFGVPDHPDIICSRLLDLGLRPSLTTYDVEGSASNQRRAVQGQGTVYIDGYGPSGPTVYVEDRPVVGVGAMSNQSGPPEPPWKYRSSLPQPEASFSASSSRQQSPSTHPQQSSSSSRRRSPSSNPSQALSSSSTSQHAAQYPQAPATGHTEAHIEDGDIWWLSKGDMFYICFFHNGKGRQTLPGDWKIEISENRITSRWVYTSQRTGTRYIRSTLDGLRTKYE